MDRNNHYDVIVIGVGSMGSAACCFLARRGVRVLGLEQFQIVHEKGSHSGQSRIIRKAYFEHPDYVPLVQRAYELWAMLEKETRTAIYHQTGVVYFGPRGVPSVSGIRKSASLYHVQVEEISRDSATGRFPAFALPPGYEVLFEPDAGFVTPERAIRAYAGQARHNGATIRENEKVLDWRKGPPGIDVRTDRGAYSCDKLVVTAGSWTQKLLPALPAALRVTQQTLAWINPKDPEAFALGNFPCWFIEDPEHGIFYGFPILPFENFGGPIGLKLACHRPGPAVDPDRADRVSTTTDTDNIRFVLSHFLPAAGDEIITLKTCLYTYTADEHFIIDTLPEHDDRVIVACGFSGHGFKFVPVVGEILADLAVKGKTDLPAGFLKLDRFRKKPAGDAP